MDEGDGTQEMAALAIGVTIAVVLAVNTLANVPWPDLFPDAPPSVRTAEPIHYQPQTDNPAVPLPPITAQFFATGIERDAWRDEPEQSVEIAQSSHWRRETRSTAEGLNNHYNDGETGASITWFRAHDNSREVLSASVDRRPSDYASATYANTNRPGRALGEPCTIWDGQFTSRGLGEQARPPYEVCVTGDGIVLWTRFHHRDGTMREVFRLTSLRRRTVPAAEAMAPPHIFQWSMWRDAAEAGAPGDDLLVELHSPPPEEGMPAQPDSEIVRTRGAWTFTHVVDGGWDEQWTIEAPNLRFYYSESEVYTASRRLQIWRVPARELERPDHAELLQPVRTETIAGLSCRWFDLGSPSHSTSTGCRTDDGLLLARSHVCDGARGGNCHFSVRATRVSRDQISDAAMAPPQAAFVWPGASR